MITQEILHLLTSFARRLAALADQAHETRQQAQHTLDRLNHLRRDVELLEQSLTAALDPINSTREPGRATRPGR